VPAWPARLAENSRFQNRDRNAFEGSCRSACRATTQPWTSRVLSRGAADCFWRGLLSGADRCLVRRCESSLRGFPEKYFFRRRSIQHSGGSITLFAVVTIIHLSVPEIGCEVFLQTAGVRSNFSIRSMLRRIARRRGSGYPGGKFQVNAVRDPRRAGTSCGGLEGRRSRHRCRVRRAASRKTVGELQVRRHSAPRER